MTLFIPPPRHRVEDIVITPLGRASLGLGWNSTTAPSSGTWGTSNLLRAWPLSLLEPFTVAKAFSLSGATVGTDSWDLGVYQMTAPATARLDLIRSTGAVLSAGSANVVQEASAWKVARANLTSGNDSTDSTTYTTASVTLKAGRLYLMSVVNTAASAGAISSITGAGTWTSRSTTQFNTTAHRVSIWSYVPTVDYTGTLVITFGATQTGCCWVLDENSGVDTTTNDGIVQQAVGTGNSTTPLATLGAFGSANNATYGATGVANTSTVAPGSGFTELAEATAATPASRVETEWRVDNDTTVDSTCTSGQWGMCAVEIKADANPFVIPADYGRGDIYMAMTWNGTTATAFRAGVTSNQIAGTLQLASTFPLPSNCSPVAASVDNRVQMCGFSSRSLLG